jgi:hypothetical protein
MTPPNADRPVQYIAIALISAISMVVVWGSLREPGAIHDERAYLLGAEIFSRGHWTAPAPPLPAFWEQMHVFVTPRVASKYPPLHSLVLVPGVWLRLPGLMPMLVVAATGVLLFALVERLADGPTAWIAWILWCTSPGELYWRASFLSQTTSGLLWLAMILSLWNWRIAGTGRAFACLSATAVLLFLTRPLTAVAVALPVALLLARTRFRGVRGREVLIALAAVLAGAAVWLTWTVQTTGTWRESPYALYSRQYFPFDRPGFGVSDALVGRPDLPSSMRSLANQFIKLHETHTVAALPGILVERTIALIAEQFGGWRILIGPFFVFGLLRSRAELRFALWSPVVLLLAYLVFAHAPAWTAYYYEVLPVVWVVIALELVALAKRIGRTVEGRRYATSAVTILCCAAGSFDVRTARQHVAARQGFHRYAEHVLATASNPALAFIHGDGYPTHDVSLVQNVASIQEAAQWRVLDRGAENCALMARAPSRNAYVFSTQTMTLKPLPPCSQPR